MRNFYVFLFPFLFYSQANALSINLWATPETCGNSNGVISVSVSGGLPPYSCMWSNGSAQFQITGLSSGAYTVTVTDANGDTATDSATVTNSPVLLYTDLSFIDPASNLLTLPCNSLCNGTGFLLEPFITGIPPYSMSIVTTSNPFMQTAIVSGVQAITNVCVNDPFTLVVYDNTGCPSSPINNPFQINPPSFECVQTVTPACFGGNNGAVTLDFIDNGYSANYDAEIMGIASVSNVNPVVFPQLPPGVHQVHLSYSQMTSLCDTMIMVTIPDLGPNCGVISGKVYIDTISNCIVDVNEPVVPQQIIRFDPGPYFTSSDASGNYSAALPFGTYSATLIPASFLYPVCNATGLNLSNVNDTIANTDLGDSVNITTDITVGITSSPFRPGFVGTLYTTMSNLSTDLIPYPQLDIYFDPQLTFVSAPYSPSVNVPGHLSFMINAMNPFSNTTFPVTFMVQPNPALIGTSLGFYAVALANIPEPDTTNNTDSLTVVVTGSFDPNDKAVDPSRDSLNSFYTNLDDEIQYRIRFQNTGTDTAFNVVVVDSLSMALDPSAFRMIAASHPFTWELSGQNVLKFHFNNILLPDSNTNEPESHGAISFAIKPYVPVAVSSIENRADIYFDFNPAVLTNVISSFITTSVGINESPAKSNLRLIPNPATDYISLNLPEGFDATSFVVTNITGQKVLQSTSGYISERIDISMLPEGYYILKVESKAGEMISGGLVIQR